MHCLHNNCTAVLYGLMLHIKFIPGTHMQCLKNNSTAVLLSLILNNKCIYQEPIYAFFT